MNEIKLTDQLTAQEVVAMYINDDALIEAPERVYRLDQKSKRVYYTFREGGEIEFYLSVTTFIKFSLPTSPFLVKWIADMGYEAAARYAQERAYYGTFLHSQTADLLINGGYDLDKLEKVLDVYLETERITLEAMKKKEWLDDLKNDILAFAQFVIEHNVKPLAIEIVLVDREHGIAGAIDAVVEMDIEEKGFFGEYYKTGAKAGQPKETKATRRVIANLDVKSGRKGFWEEHEIQLKAYKEMWNKLFPQKQIEKSFNWGPKDWRGSIPTYNLKDQTDTKAGLKLDHLIKIAKLENDGFDNDIIIKQGAIDLKKGLLPNIQVIKLSDLLKDNKEATPETEL